MVGGCCFLVVVHFVSCTSRKHALTELLQFAPCIDRRQVGRYTLHTRPHLAVFKEMPPKPFPARGPFRRDGRVYKKALVGTSTYKHAAMRPPVVYMLHRILTTSVLL